MWEGRAQTSCLALLLAGSSCLHRMAPIPEGLEPQRAAEAESLRQTVHALVDARFNPARLRAAERRASEFGLTWTREWIDWFSFQHNVVIELPGRTDRLVYLVAHADKTDANPFKLASLMVNGLIDEVTGLTYVGEGALDNATGVAVILETARSLAKLPRGPTVRVLITGAEESGLRGARAHVARIPNEEWERIDAVINVDSVGKAGEPTCLVSDVSEPALMELARKTATERNVKLNSQLMPAIGGGDHDAFRRTSFFHDLGRGLLFNATGGLLPQRSWFTGFHSAPVLGFFSCNLIDAGDYAASLILLPLGALHGPRDNAANVDPVRLLEAYRIVEGTTRRLVELGGAEPPAAPATPAPL